MKFGDIDNTVFGFGQSEEGSYPKYCMQFVEGYFEYKICKAPPPTDKTRISLGGEKKGDKIRIRSKELNKAGLKTCKSPFDHVVTTCLCMDPLNARPAKTRFDRDCIPQHGGWQSFTFRMTKRIDLLGGYFDCTEKTAEYSKSVGKCRGCHTIKYDKEFLIEDFFGDFTQTYSYEGESMLVAPRGPEGREWCEESPGSQIYWCSPDALILYHHATKSKMMGGCGAKESLNPDRPSKKFASLTEEVKDCLLATLDCPTKNEDVAATLISMFMSQLVEGWVPPPSGNKSEFPVMDCQKEECIMACEDDVMENPKCK